MSSWGSVLATLLRGESLRTEEAAWAMREVMAGQATAAQIAGFAIALRAKGETAPEVAGLVATMLDHALPLHIDGSIVDIVGSGGDRSHTVNISTMAAVVTAAAGATVVKHGNRAASSSCGAADLLEELGVAIDLPPAGVAECVREVGIGFCFAPVFHPALRHAAVARRELGVATVFNFLGPLANPARPRAQAVGVSDARMAPVLAGVLAARGCSALVFRGDDGLDELTTTTTSSVWVTRDGEVHEATVDPRRFGIRAADPADLRGADAAYNAKVARSVLGGEPGPVRDTVALNAAAGLTAYSLTDAPLDEQLAAGLERARAALDSGRPAELLERWAAASQQAARSMSA